MTILLKWSIRTLISFCLLASVMTIVCYSLASRSLPNYNQSLVSDKINDKIEIKKFDPVVRKHVLYKESKIK